MGWQTKALTGHFTDVLKAVDAKGIGRVIGPQNVVSDRVGFPCRGTGVNLDGQIMCLLRDKKAVWRTEKLSPVLASTSIRPIWYNLYVATCSLQITRTRRESRAPHHVCVRVPLACPVPGPHESDPCPPTAFGLCAQNPRARADMIP